MRGCDVVRGRGGVGWGGVGWGGVGWGGIPQLWARRPGNIEQLSGESRSQVSALTAGSPHG